MWAKMGRVYFYLTLYLLLLPLGFLWCTPFVWAGNWAGGFLNLREIGGVAGIMIGFLLMGPLVKFFGLSDRVIQLDQYLFGAKETDTTSRTENTRDTTPHEQVSLS